MHSRTCVETAGQLRGLQVVDTLSANVPAENLCLVMQSLLSHRELHNAFRFFHQVPCTGRSEFCSHSASVQRKMVQASAPNFPALLGSGICTPHPCEVSSRDLDVVPAAVDLKGSLFKGVVIRFFLVWLEMDRQWQFNSRSVARLRPCGVLGGELSRLQSPRPQITKNLHFTPGILAPW